MVLDIDDLKELHKKVVDRIYNEINIANRSNKLEEYLTKIGCLDLIQKCNTIIDVRRAKILVLGKPDISMKEMEDIARKNGINPNRIEFHLDYKKNKRFNIAQLRNNLNYSDIIIGPISHKMMGLGDNTSAIAMIEHNPEEYPKLNKATDGNALKITKSSFDKCIKNTFMYMEQYSY